MRTLRLGWIAPAVIASVLLSSGLAGAATADEESDAAQLSTVGQLLVVADFGADLTITAGQTDVEPLPEHHSYSVLTDAGQLIAVDGEFPESASTGDRFEGTLSIPTEVALDVGVAAGAVVEADSTLGIEVIEAAAEAEAPLVLDASVLTEYVVDFVSSPSAHTMDVVIVGGAINTGALATVTARMGPYWTAETNGRISSFTQNPTVRTLTYPPATPCGPNLNILWANAAQTFGRTTNNYFDGTGRHLVVILPATCNSVTGTGVGTLGSSIHQGGLVVVTNVGDVAVTTLAHELGHNMGLGHGNVSYCGTASYDEGLGCTVYEYNDVYNIMGYAIDGYGSTLPALPASHRDWLAVYGAGEIAVQSPTGVAPLSNATYTLKPASDPSGLQAIKVTDPFTGKSYYVELRSGTLADAGAFYTTGSLWGLPSGQQVFTGTGVRVLQIDSSDLANNAATSTAFAVSTPRASASTPFMALRTGEDFTSRGGGLRIVVDAISPSVGAPISATVTVTTGGWSGVNPPPAVTRINGVDRFAVGVGISEARFLGPNPVVPIVYVTTGYNYPDALSAAPAAAKFGGPLLLTEPNALPPSVRAEIIRLKPQKIVVVGGPGSVSAAVFSDLQTLTTGATVRLGGADRYEASRNIVKQSWCPGSAPCPSGISVYIATGNNFPDALSASGAGGAFNMPVLLVDGTASGIDAATRALLLQLAPTAIKIAGGPGSVSPGIETALRQLAPTTRLSGADRFVASANIAKNAFASAPPSTVYIATGFNFPDALAGAALAGAEASPLIVVPTDCVPGEVLAAVDGWAATKVILLGGPASLTPRVFQLARC